MATQVIKSILKGQVEARLQLIEEQSKEDLQLISAVPHLQKSAELMDVLIYNLEKYHTEVKNKCKVQYQKGSAIPDKIEEQVFAGKYSHPHTLSSILSFIEFMIIESQKGSQGGEDGGAAVGEMTVSLGIENMKRLWYLFVKEPNFQTDQTLFLNWVNESRVINVIRTDNYQQYNDT